MELSTKNIQIFIKNNFFDMNEKLMYKNVMKKNQNTVCLKKLLVKTTIVFTSIYFELYCKIPGRPNKSIP